MSEPTPTGRGPTITPEAAPDALASSLGPPSCDPDTVPASPPPGLVVDRVCPECHGTGEVSFQSTDVATGIKACPTCRPGE